MVCLLPSLYLNRTLRGSSFPSLKEEFEGNQNVEIRTFMLIVISTRRPVGCVFRGLGNLIPQQEDCHDNLNNTRNLLPPKV